MLLQYCRVPGGNFGDDLNVQLWTELFPGLQGASDRFVVWGIGTLLGRFHEEPSRNLVLGSGYGGGRLRPDRPRNVDYVWVRGPLTADAAGLAPEKALTDPAILWSALRGAKAPCGRHRVGLVPHHLSMAACDWGRVCELAGVHLIDPRQPPARVAEEIASCGRILVESLHGAIFADVLRVPFIPVILRHRFNFFKWQDWTASVGLPFHPLIIGPALTDRAPGFDEIMKACFWKAAARLAIVPPYRALRATRASRGSDYLETAAHLAAAACRDDRVMLSREGVLDSLSTHMLERCEVVSRQYGLGFVGA